METFTFSEFEIGQFLILYAFIVKIKIEIKIALDPHLLFLTLNSLILGHGLYFKWSYLIKEPTLSKMKLLAQTIAEVYYYSKSVSD